MHRLQRLSIFLVALAALSTVFFVASAGATPIYEYSTSFGSRGTGNGQFQYGPSAVATDSAGNFWVADHEGGNVQKFNPKGEFLLKVTKGIYSLNPKDVAVDSAGNIWVTDPGGERVVEFSSTGTYIREFGEFGSGPGQFWLPEYIAIDSSGNLWVTDGGNHRVQEFSSTGKYIRQFGSEGTGNGQFTGMGGIAIDAENNVWVADQTNETARIEEFNSSGAYIKQIGNGILSGGSQEDSLSSHSGNLWVSDSDHSCVKVLNTNGEVLTQFGGVEPSEGEMLQPASIVFDPSGNPWVLVPAHAKIEKWVPNLIPQYLEEMAVDNPFDGSTASLSNFSAQWAALGWATGTYPKGKTPSRAGGQPTPSLRLPERTTVRMWSTMLGGGLPLSPP